MEPVANKKAKMTAALSKKFFILFTHKKTASLGGVFVAIQHRVEDRFAILWAYDSALMPSVNVIIYIIANLAFILFGSRVLINFFLILL